MKPMKSKIREYVWFALAIICTGIGIHQTYLLGIGKSYIFFVFAIFAILFFCVRKTLRKNNPANSNNK
jgi:hypothetical protein